MAVLFRPNKDVFRLFVGQGVQGIKRDSNPNDKYVLSEKAL